jgi:hypothetical protein
MSFRSIRHGTTSEISMAHTGDIRITDFHEVKASSSQDTNIKSSHHNSIGMKIGGVYLEFSAVRNSPSVKIKSIS